MSFAGRNPNPCAEYRRWTSHDTLCVNCSWNKESHPQTDLHKVAQDIARKRFSPDTEAFAKCVGAILEAFSVDAAKEAGHGLTCLRANPHNKYPYLKLVADWFSLAPRYRTKKQLKSMLDRAVDGATQ